MDNMSNDRTLIAKTRSTSASVSCSGSRRMGMPALFTRMSMPSTWSNTALASRMPAPDSARSAGITTGSFESSAATRSRSLVVRPLNTTRAPAASSALADDSPIPRLAPVTTAILLCKSAIVRLNSGSVGPRWMESASACCRLRTYVASTRRRAVDQERLTITKGRDRWQAERFTSGCALGSNDVERIFNLALRRLWPK